MSRISIVGPTYLVRAGGVLFAMLWLTAAGEARAEHIGLLALSLVPVVGTGFFYISVAVLALQGHLGLGVLLLLLGISTEFCRPNRPMFSSAVVFLRKMWLALWRTRRP